ncbi:MAG: hypothetical protein HY820_16150 [Acidobacteria bacterium]|nr:hypothetical protein [Acidobacteriota bacterium]
MPVQPLELRAIIDKHSVKYETWPHYEIHEGKRVMVGFDLELHGTHGHGQTWLRPGCDLCKQTYDDLTKIAVEILPHEERPSKYEIQPFDNSIHFDRRGPGEVVLAIRIYHRHEYFSPVDRCEERCLGEMENKLGEFGIPGRRH